MYSVSPVALTPGRCGRYRYDFRSNGSRSGFLSNGETNAALKCVGNTPDDSDLLNSSMMNGASTSTLSFRRCVGSGSVAHSLSGSLRMAAVMSTVRTRNVEKSQPDGVDTKHGGGVLDVELRTPAILSENRCSFCASMDVDGGTRPRPMRASIDYHRRRGVERSNSSFACQNGSRFWRRRSRYARRSVVQEAAAI